ncbi:MAG TPA: hypothetical protein VKP30_18905, partial [Polyangiaceae bacterium]|nr:hypothetical protein [Polyangiaceae bacterium]
TATSLGDCDVTWRLRRHLATATSLGDCDVTWRLRRHLATATSGSAGRPVWVAESFVGTGE